LSYPFVAATPTSEHIWFWNAFPVFLLEKMVVFAVLSF
jgi:hypothetical protein